MAVVSKIQELGRGELCLIYDGCLVDRESESPLDDNTLQPYCAS